MAEIETDKMTPEHPRRVSVLAGVHSVATAAVSETVRVGLTALSGIGVQAMRQRRAWRLLQPALNAPSVAARSRVMLRLSAGAHVFLCHKTILGRQADAFGERILYPDAEAGAAALGALFPEDALRLVIGLPRLTTFFSTAPRALARRVRQTKWDILYELSWADRIEMIQAVLPKAEIVVLTDEGAARQSEAVAPLLWGAPIGDPDVFRIAHLSPEGRRRLEAGEDLTTLWPELARRADQEALDKIGIDESLARLLDDRFEDDLVRLARMDNLTLV